MQVQVVDIIGNMQRISEINVITQRELAQDNVQAFGMFHAAKILAKKKVPFAIAYWLLLGRAPRSLRKAPMDGSVRLADMSGLQVAQSRAMMIR